MEEIDNTALIGDVRLIRQDLPRLGVRKLQLLLAEKGHRVSRDKLFALLRASGMLVKRTHTRIITTYSRHWMKKWPNLIKDRVPIPFVHMIRETAAEMARKFPGGRIGIMATVGTVKTGLYQNILSEYGLQSFTPSDEVQSLVMHEIYDCIKAGKRYDEEAFMKIEKEFRSAGCDSVLLACTELSVIKADEDLDDWYTDPMLVMARRCIEACGKEYI